ncbi:MAG: hypothetical protein ABSF54_08495 [Bryobacteraceae bacterium]|jgi:hypothetical protein
MPERRVKVPMPPLPGLQDGFDVQVSESTEKWTEVTLEDGTVLRVKASVLGAFRADGKWDAQGNPMYALKAQIVSSIVSVPEHLRRPAGTAGQVN